MWARSGQKLGGVWWAVTIRAIVVLALDTGLLVVAHAVTTAALQLATDTDVEIVTHTAVNRELIESEAATLAVAGAVLVPRSR